MNICKIIIVIFIIISNYGFSQTNYTKTEKIARNKIFDLKFNQVPKILKNNKSKTTYYLLCYNEFLKNILIGGSDNYKSFENQFDISSKNISKSVSDSLKYIYLSEIYLQNAIVKLLNKDFISGGMSFIESFGYFKDARKKYPKSYYNIKLSALYNIIAGITPDKAKFFLKTIGLNGNILLGVKQMKIYFQTEKVFMQLK